MWHLVNPNDLLKAGGKSFLHLYDGSFLTALMRLFPELSLQKQKFNDVRVKWSTPEEGRKFFDEFAQRKQLKSLDAENWYSVTKKDIQRAGGGRILRRYGDSLMIALTNIYPELLFVKKRFRNYDDIWEDPKQQRHFFDQFALSKHFNPLEADRWYNIRQYDVIAAGGMSVLKYHKGSHVVALSQVYPELSLQKEKFPNAEEGWYELANRKVFFDEFAKSRQFDPLIPEMWYPITKQDILRAGGKGILSFHISHVAALRKLYPGVKFKKEMFVASKYKNAQRKKHLVSLIP